MLGERLKQLRKNIGLSQVQLADILGIDRSTYAYYETNKTNPSIPYLIVLSRIFCITVDELIGVDETLRLRDQSGISVPENNNPPVDEELLRLADLSKEEKMLIIKFRLLDDKSEIYKYLNSEESES